MGDQWVLISGKHLETMRKLIDNMSRCLREVSSTFQREKIDIFLSEWEGINRMLCGLNKKIGEEFQDGKINKNTLLTQIQASHTALQQQKISNQQKDKEMVKFSSELTKVLHENQKLREYLKKLKEQNKGNKGHLQQVVQELTEKFKKYRIQCQQKMINYQAKIKFLETKIQSIDEIGDDLDKQLEELAKLQNQGAEQQGERD